MVAAAAAVVVAAVAAAAGRAEAIGFGSTVWPAETEADLSNSCRCSCIGARDGGRLEWAS